MILKTPALVLRTQKFRDTSLILSFFTREHGRVDCLAKGVRSGRNRSRQAYFQTASLLDIVFYDKAGRELQNLSESALRHAHQRLQHDPKRVLYAMLVCEIVLQAFPEREPQPEAFDRIEARLVSLDGSHPRLFLELIGFVLDVCELTGLRPQVHGEPDEPLLFDLQEGLLRPANGGAQPEARALAAFLTTADETQWQLPPDCPRRALLHSLLQYLSLQLPGFRSPSSLAVFEAVFAPPAEPKQA